MADRTYTSGQQKPGDRKTITGISSERGADDAAADAASRSKFTGFTAAKAGASGGGSDMPKQAAGESPAAYGARLREYRAKKQAAIK